MKKKPPMSRINLRRGTRRYAISFSSNSQEVLFRANLSAIWRIQLVIKNNTPVITTLNPNLINSQELGFSATYSDI
jgi:hypothetical protein